MKVRHNFLFAFFALSAFLSCWISSNAQEMELEYQYPVKMQDDVNSPEAEESLPLLTSDGNTLYFVRSFHPKNNGGIGGGQDIWVATKKDDGSWSKPKNANSPISTIGDNAVIGISEDGNTLYLKDTYSEDDQYSNGISFSTREGNDWTAPQKIEVPNLNINSQFYGFYMNAAQDVLLISMGREDALGQEDLYVSTKGDDGKWSDPKNLGNTINTPGFEMSPFLASDGKTLYFSSDGHRGLADADIFKAERLDDSWTNWSKPENLGNLINSNFFDAYFTITPQNEIFFSSNRGGPLSDIYYSKIIQPELTTDTLSLEEKIAKEDFTITELEVDELINLPPNTLELIHFDFDMYTLHSLDERDKETLDEVVLVMNKNKNLNVILEGHADAIGTNAYNKLLSQSRVNSAKDYLLANGIALSRITFRAFGEENPVASNQTEEGRARNRRVEIKFAL